ncbi:hypothetical protein HDU88_008924 [Geranomyces variabilis]|nr:hypothetical protein HDU88_008924 [Geranomyces variabilis]
MTLSDRCARRQTTYPALVLPYKELRAAIRENLISGAILLSIFEETRESPDIDTGLLFSCDPAAWAEDAISALRFVAGQDNRRELGPKDPSRQHHILEKAREHAQGKGRSDTTSPMLRENAPFIRKRKRTINDDEAGENGNGARREDGAHAGAIGGQSSTGAEQGEDGDDDVASVASANENRHEEARDEREDDVAEASNKYFDLMSTASEQRNGHPLAVLLASAVEERRKTEKRKGHFARLERAKELLAEVAEIIHDVEENLEQALEEEVEDEAAT